MSHAHLYLAGCGPYSEDYISTLLIEQIAQADVILYDRLINPLLLRHAKSDTIVEYVGKNLNEKTHTQSAINERILYYLNQNKRVIRLKSGDPFLFGRGFEEYILAQNNHFPVTVIPGMSSSLAIASHIGLPLTLRDISHGITILTGMNAQSEIPTYHYTSQNKQHSYVFLMSVQNFETISKQMINAGFSPLTPAIAISNGTYPNQQITASTLDHIHHKMRIYGQANPAIIIVSPTISFWQQHYRPRILSTKIDGSDFEILDQTHHLETIHHPLLTPIPHPLSQAHIQQIDEAQTIVLSSPITAQYAKKILSQSNEKQIIAIGPKTKAVADTLFSNVQYEPMVTSLQSFIDNHQVEKTVILTSSYGKDTRIHESFNHIIIPIFKLEPIQHHLFAASFDAMTVYSPSSLEVLISAIYGSQLVEYFTLPLFCFGKNVYEKAITSPFQQPILIETNQHDYFYQHIYLYFKERFSL